MTKQAKATQAQAGAAIAQALSPQAVVQLQGLAAATGLTPVVIIEALIRGAAKTRFQP